MIEHLGWANFVFLLGILGGAALGAILWGTISSTAGYSIISTKQRFMLFGVIARGLAVLLASVVTIVASGPLLGVTLPNGMERLLFPFVSSFESMARDIPAVVSLGIILTCFLSIFQQREILKKINIRRNLASLPLAIKILIGYGIFTWLAAAFYQGVTTGTLEVYPQYGLVSVLVLTGAFLACFAFLRKPAPEKGFLLIGFIIASIGAVSLLFAVPLYGRDSLWVGIANVNSLLVPIFFSIFMISWLHRKEIKMFINELRLKP
jgi:MFS family permease